MRYQAILFDLDGTLADTLADIAAAANHALTRLKRPTHEVEHYRLMVGRGLARLFGQALAPADDELIQRAAAMFEQHYALHGTEQTELYPGVADLLDALNKLPLKLAVLSNKPEAGTQDTVQHVLSRWRFDVVRGHRPPAKLKPDPGSALTICRELAIAPEHWLYVGDTGVDMQTAVGAGMFPVGVLWGFREEPELRQNGAQAVIADPKELLELLG
jgi:phosphoglycolate phosphatase